MQNIESQENEVVNNILKERIESTESLYDEQLSKVLAAGFANELLQKRFQKVRLQDPEHWMHTFLGASNKAMIQVMTDRLLNLELNFASFLQAPGVEERIRHLIREELAKLLKENSN